MLKWNSLHRTLDDVDIRHQKLATRFDRFAKYIAEQVTHQSFHIKGISASIHLEQRYFTTTFAGRTLHFVFSSHSDDGASLSGNVKCYFQMEFPERKLIEMGEFTYNGSGQTNLVDPEHNDPLTISDELNSLYIALHFVHESLLH